MRDALPSKDGNPEESENLSHRALGPFQPRGPLITKSEPDFVLRTLAGIVVALLGFVCVAVWNSNRELGEIKTEAKSSREATDRRIDSLEIATDRRVTSIENATDRRITQLEQKVWGR